MTIKISLLISFISIYALSDNLNAEEKLQETKIVDTSNAFYGDYSSNNLHVINLDLMKVTQTLHGGIGAYGAEPVGNKYIISLTRKDNSIDILKVDKNKKRVIHTIQLGYLPREVTTSPSKKYSVVSGKNIAAHTIFNTKTGKVIKHIDRDYEEVTITDFGGQNATGHPFFVNETEYLILDRDHKEIRLYNVETGLLDTLKTKTTMHHILRKGKYLYVAMEGSGNSPINISPAILKIKILNHKIYKSSITYLEKNPKNFKGDNMLGIHHINFHYNGRHIYIVSNNSKVYVISTLTMKVVDTFPSGKGAGHIDFSPKREMAIVTNHKSSFITLVDVKNPAHNRVIKNLEVADYEKGRTMQGHTQAVSDDENYFYGAATHDGVFFRVNLLLQKITKRLEIKNAELEQGWMYQSTEGAFAKRRKKFSTNSVKIRNIQLNQALGVTKLGEKVILSKWNNLQKQGWDIKVRHNKQFNLVNRNNHMCLTNSRHHLILKECHTQKQEQRWKLRTISRKKNIYQIVSIKDSNCISNSKNLSIEPCNKKYLPLHWEVSSILNANTKLNRSTF